MKKILIYSLIGFAILFVIIGFIPDQAKQKVADEITFPWEQ